MGVEELILSHLDACSWLGWDFMIHRDCTS